MRMARRAGNRPDAATTAINARAAPARTAGSAGVTPKRNRASRREDAAVPAQADGRARARQKQVLPNDQFHHRGRGGAERHANADLPGSARDRIRCHTERAHGGQPQREAGEEAHQQRVEAARFQPRLYNVGHGSDLGHRLILIDFGDSAAHGRGKGAHIAGGADDQDVESAHRRALAGEGQLLVQRVNVTGGGLLRRGLPHVLDNADDGEPGIVEADTFAQGGARQATRRGPAIR